MSKERRKYEICMKFGFGKYKDKPVAVVMLDDPKLPFMDEIEEHGQYERI